MFLSWLGVVIGVAVVVAIDLANESSRKSFEYANRVVDAGASHQIVAVIGDIDEQLYADLRRAGVYFATPIITGEVRKVSGHEQRFRVLGIEPLSRNLAPGLGDETEKAPTLSNQWIRLLAPGNGILLFSENAADLDLKTDDQLDVSVLGETRELTVAGVISANNEVQRTGLRNTLIMDISTAQELLDLRGFLSHIDLNLKDPDQTLSKVKSLLPDGVVINAIETGQNAQRQMTRAFQINLTALSLLALLIGMFLIYNAMTFSVVRRRTQIGVLRSIGVTSWQVFIMVLAEAAIVGFVASACGLLLGYWLAGGLLTLVTRTLDDLYFAIYAAQLNPSLLTGIKAWSLGILATLAATIMPAWEATRTHPSLVLNSQHGETQIRRSFQNASGIGLIFFLLGVALCFLPNRSLVLGFIALFFLVAGYALVMPRLCASFLNAVQRISYRPFSSTFSIGVRRVNASLSRTAPAIVALTIAMSAVIGVSVMIDSFRGSVEQWLFAQLRGDAYLSVPSSSQTGLPRVFLDDIRKLPGVDHIGLGRWTSLQTSQGELNLFALNVKRNAFGGFVLKQGDPNTAWQNFQLDNTVLVSEPFSYRYEIAIGDSLVLPTLSGERSFEVAGVYYDYSSDQGVVLMPMDTFRKYWSDDTISSASLYLKPEIEIDKVIETINELPTRPKNLRLRSTKTLREASLAVFDRTFTITEVLRFLALIVAIIGMLAALLAIQIERARETAVIRAIGLLPRQVWSMLFTETGIMGAMAGLFSIPLGIGMASVLIFIINRRSFGWSMQILVEPILLIQALALAIVTTMVAAMYPAWKLSRTPPAIALRNE